VLRTFAPRTFAPRTSAPRTSAPRTFAPRTFAPRTLAPSPRFPSCAGFTLIEVIFVAGLVAVLSGMAVPQLMVTVDRQRAWAATRYVAARMTLARAQAVKRSAYVALRFEQKSSDMSFGMFVDGNRNGVRTRDIAASIDTPLEAPVRLSDLFPGVSISLAGDLMSFSPLGTASSGTVYIRGRDGSQLAVRVLGVTGRARCLRYNPRTRQWVDF
jgi:prepilin-type N-terminal cleavage/methylation domain-containing protein